MGSPPYMKQPSHPPMSTFRGPWAPPSSISYSPLRVALHCLAHVVLVSTVIMKSRHSFQSGFTLTDLEPGLGIVFGFNKYEELKNSSIACASSE